MKKSRSLLFPILFWLCFTASTFAKSWISVGSPVAYNFINKSLDNAVYQMDDPVGTTPTGYILHLDLPLPALPIIGIEKYKLTLHEASATDEDSELELNFYDILYSIREKKFTALLGAGVGNVEFTCKSTDCSSLNFSQGTARQFFLKIGIPFAGFADFHISIHRVYALVNINDGSNSAEMNFGGFMFGAGVKVGW